MKKLFIITLVVIGMFACAEHRNTKDGALPGKFSVSSYKQVHFSQGNLQYQASTNTWRFAENQWDIIGEGNANISPTYMGWIDLFGWGTGNNPTNSSTENNDYVSFVEWGEKIACNSNGDNIQWRTLSGDEWRYLFCGRKNAENLFGFGRVNGVCGLIVLPDDWETPIGLMFYPSLLKGLSRNMFRNSFSNPSEINYSHNTYSVDDWKKMEHAGAVFLPAAGERYNIYVKLYDDNYPMGCYWSSSRSQNLSYWDSGSLDFFSKSFYPDSYGHRCLGLSVRLVCDLQD